MVSSAEELHCMGLRFSPALNYITKLQWYILRVGYSLYFQTFLLSLDQKSIRLDQSKKFILEHTVEGSQLNCVQFALKV